MTQKALKEAILEQAEPHVSDALSSIKDTIKGNLEKGFEHFKDPQQEEVKLDLQETPKTADVFYLTDVLEADGSITTLKKQGETGMSDTETKTEKPMALDASAELPAVEPTEAPEATAEVAPETAEAPAMPASFATTPAADFEIGGDTSKAAPGPDLASNETMVESAAAFSELANMARQLSSSPQATTGEPVTPDNAGGYTVDALMREMLRPLLKEWLDAHLPSLVKWLVTEQIEKMLKDQLGVMPTPVTTETSATPADVPTVPTVPIPEAVPETGAEDETADSTTGMDFDTPAA